MTIPKASEKIKRAGKVLMEAFVFVGILCLAFVLGRISVVSMISTSSKTDISIVYPPLVRTDVPVYNNGGAVVVGNDEINHNEPDVWNFAASKSGKIYYPKECKSLSRVKPENRIYFITEQQAKGAGYTLSATCDSFD